MELTQLKYFLETAKNQHVTRSAEALHIAQPALTQAIHRLEGEFGVPLFSREGRGIRLSPYGAYLYKKLLPLMQQLEDIPHQLETMARLENNTIHLNVLAASSLVTEALIEYQHIDDTLRVELRQNAASDLYDINVTTRQFVLKDSQTAHDEQFVCTERIFLAVPARHQLAEKKTVALAEVHDAPFIELLGSRELRSICDGYCAQAGVRPNIIFESDSPQAVRNMIAANMGIGFWPEFSWGSLDTDRVRLLEIREPVCSRDILIAYRRNKQDNTKTEAFFRFLAEYFAGAAERQVIR